MCGIIGYTGKKEAKPVLIEGLKRLEYRGYDSAGIAVQGNGNGIVCHKSLGKIADLQNKINGIKINGTCGIAHTRWATHGKPAETNAHPHHDSKKSVYLVHNGIIENYRILKKELNKQGCEFYSETDSEILAHLIAKLFNGNLTEAVRQAVERVEGTFALAVIHRELPDQIVVARRGSPLILGVGENEYLAASDAEALIRHTNEVIHLRDNEIAALNPDNFSIITTGAKKISRSSEIIEIKQRKAELNGYPYFTLKEIYEQPDAVTNAMRGRLDVGEGMPKLGGLENVLPDLIKSKHLILTACGTSFYAALIGKYIFEELTECDVQVELASEFCYRKLRFSPDTFLLALSQSGETADTKAAMQEAKRKGARLIGMVNVVESSMTQMTEAGIFNYAGPEIGVASTKIFTSQLTILALLALLIGRHQKLSLMNGVKSLKAMRELPKQVESILAGSQRIEAIAKKYFRFKNWLYIGRKYNYPIALEGALKLKEISYIHAEGYPAGEMKHGPIALINPKMPTVAIVPQDDMRDKMISNIMEIKSRQGPVIAIITERDEEIKTLADDYIEIPFTLDFLNPILTVIPCQLLAYYCALFLNRDIDKPRNLAKSVTVE